LTQLAFELHAQRVAGVPGVGAAGRARKWRRSGKRCARWRDFAALEGGAEDQALTDRHVDTSGLHVRAPTAAQGAADERPVAELILGKQGGARIAAPVGDALAATGGEGGRDAVVAILRQRERAVQDAAGAELGMQRDQA